MKRRRGGLHMSGIVAAEFRCGEVVGHVALDDMRPQNGDDDLIWIEVEAPQERDLLLLQERFGLNGRAIQDSRGSVRGPKVEVYDDQVFVVLKTLRIDADALTCTAIDAYVSRRHIVTVLHRPDAPGHSHTHFRNAPRPSRPEPAFILHSIIDMAVDDYLPVMQMIEEQVLEMERQLLESSLDCGQLTRLFKLRRETIRLQHLLAGMADVCGKLANLELPCIDATLRPYFRDVQERLVRLEGAARGLVDEIRAVFEASNLVEQQRLGAGTRQLAGWAAILGAPTLVAAIYDMNFEFMPGLHARFGFHVVIGLMLGLCIGLFIWFRRLRWV